MVFSLQDILNLLITYKYAVLFPITIVEGPAVSIVAGSLTAAGYFSFPIVYGVVVLGDIVGDCMYYAIGRYGGLYFIRHWNHILKVNVSRIVSLEKTFAKHGPKLLFIGKTQGLGSLVLMSAGLIKYPFREFILYNTIASIIKSFILVYIGYIFSKQYATTNNYIFKVGIVLSFVGLIAAYIYMRRRNKAENIEESL